MQSPVEGAVATQRERRTVPDMDMDSDPCSYCGSSVHIESQRMSSEFGSPVVRTRQVRVCDDQGCPSNNGRRTFGQGV